LEPVSVAKAKDVMAHNDFKSSHDTVAVCIESAAGVSLTKVLADGSEGIVGVDVGVH
jgi:hypothetical protein